MDSSTDSGLFASSPKFFELADSVVPRRMLKEEKFENLAPRSINITNAGLQIELHYTHQHPDPAEVGFTPKVFILRANLNCVHREDRKQQFFLELALENNETILSIHEKALDRASPEMLTYPFNTVRCRRIRSLRESEINIGQDGSEPAS